MRSSTGFGGVSAAGKLDRIATGFQLFPEKVPEIPLDFNALVTDAAAHAAALLEGAREVFECSPGEGYTVNHGDGLAAASLGFAADTHDAIPGIGGASITADAAGDRALALWAEPAVFCGIDGPAIVAFAHGVFVSRRWRDDIILWLASQGLESQGLASQRMARQ